MAESLENRGIFVKVTLYSGTKMVLKNHAKRKFRGKRSGKAYKMNVK